MDNRPPRILAVDDNKQNLEILRKTLTTAAYEIITANDGPTALNLIESALPDLVLLDVMMPGMSGYEVCERIRANQTTRLLPVVMLTALSDVADRIRGIETGADDFSANRLIAKSFSPGSSRFSELRRSTTTLRQRTGCSAPCSDDMFPRRSRLRSLPIPGVI